MLNRRCETPRRILMTASRKEQPARMERQALRGQESKRWSLETVMKRFYVALLLPFVLAIPVIAGEAGITYTYQVLDGLAEGGARIERVYCLDHFAHSGMPTAFQLIAAPNIPPSNAPGPVKDVNLVSASGIAISLATDSNHLQITIMRSMFRCQLDSDLLRKMFSRPSLRPSAKQPY